MRLNPRSERGEGIQHTKRPAGEILTPIVRTKDFSDERFLPLWCSETAYDGMHRGRDVSRATGINRGFQEFGMAD